MRFLVDRCAGRRLARWLAAQGHDIVEPSGRAPDPSDEELLRRAHGERRILVTIDSDFGRLIHLQGLPFCGLIRLPDVPADVRIALMGQILETYDEAGTAKPDRHRAWQENPDFASSRACPTGARP